jgi:hypothetical protein
MQRSLLLAGLCSLCACTGFRYEVYVAELDGAPEGVTTSAHGRAVLLVSRDADRADITLTISDVTSTILGSHVRQAPRGESGPPVLTLWEPGMGAFDNQHPVLQTWQRSTSATPTPMPGADRAPSATSVPFDDTMLQALRSANLYVNLETRARPSGEIRGQLLPE